MIYSPQIFSQLVSSSRPPSSRLWYLLAPLLLSGCATQALDTAPGRPDRPWQPNVAVGGELVPGKPSPHTLTVPAGYTLPSNEKIHVRPPPSELGLQTGHAYSLSELIDIAQSSNPETRRAWNLARDAALTVGITKSTYLPRLTATVVGGYNHSRNDGASPSISNGGVTGDIINSGLNGLNSALGGIRNSRSGAGEIQTLGLEWLLFDFGKREAIIAATEQAQIATNILFTAAHQKIIYNVTTAYYTHAAAQNRVALLHKAQDNARFVEAAATARLHQGQGTIIDVTQARQATAQTELRLVQAEGDEQNTALELLNAIGLSPNTKLETLDISGRPLGLNDIRLTDALVQQAVSRRPDVLAAYAHAKAAKSRVQAAKSEFLPKIFMTGNVAYTTGRLALSSVPGVGSEASPTLNLSSNAFSSLIMGGITVPIFDGGTRVALLKQAEDQSDSAEATVQQTIDSSVKQIVAAENALHTSLSAYAASEKLETAAMTGFKASTAAYQSGVGSMTQVSISQNAYLDAMLSHSDAYYTALIAAASLAFGTGSLSQNEGL